MLQITPDGHCLFSAVADQLDVLGLLPHSAANYTTVRRVAADYILNHPDDFLPFLPSASGEDGAGAASSGLMSKAEFQSYCQTMRDTGAWGGEPEITALCRAYHIPIHVIQGAQPPIVEHNPTNDPPPKHPVIVRLSYHRRMYGLGEVCRRNIFTPEITDTMTSITTLYDQSRGWLVPSSHYCMHDLHAIDLYINIISTSCCIHDSIVHPLYHKLRSVHDHISLLEQSVQVISLWSGLVRHVPAECAFQIGVWVCRT